MSYVELRVDGLEERLREAIERPKSRKQPVTAKEIAEALDTTRTTIYRYLDPKTDTQPSFAAMKAISELTGYSLDWFAGMGAPDEPAGSARAVEIRVGGRKVVSTEVRGSETLDIRLTESA